MGRFNFVSPGAAMFTGLHQMLRERELQRREDKKAEEDAARLKMDQDRDKRAADAAKIAERAADLQIKVTQAAMDRASKAEASTDVETAGVGGLLPGAAGERAKLLVPGMVNVTPGQLASHTLDMPVNATPSVTQTPPSEDGSLPMVEPQAPEAVVPPVVMEGHEDPAIAEQVVSKGTHQQQVMDWIKKNPQATDRELMLKLIEASGDTNIPASAATMLSTADKTIPVFRRSDKGDIEKQDEKGNWVKFVGNLPKEHKIINEPNPAGANGPAPFYAFLPSANGYVPGNTRTGQHYNPETKQWEDGAIPLRPTGGQGQQMADNAAALSQIQLLKEEFKPEWLGPVSGRAGSMYTKFVNDKDSATLARFQTRTAAMKNRYIKAITGAQMSEAEAIRLMNQLPDMNLPPVTYWERLAVSEQELNNVLEIQQQVYTGQRKPSENPVTEAQLQKLFPDSAFTGGAGKTIAPMPGGESKSGDSAKSARDRAKELIDAAKAKAAK